MSAKSLPCTHFDTPEGRWTLASEFTTENAANQFMPHIGRDAGCDDLCLGASGAESHPLPITPTVPNGAGGMRFGAASAAMASGGLMFADSSPQVSSRATSAVTASIPKSNLYMLANRPTQVSIFRAPGVEPSVGAGTAAPASSYEVPGTAPGANGTGANETPTNSGGRGYGFRQGRLNFGRGAAGAQGSSSGASYSSAGAASIAGSGQTTAASATTPAVAAATAAAAQPLHSKGIVTKSTSAYVSRIITNENLARWIVGDNLHSTYLLFNAPRCVAWVGLQPESNGETLARFDLVSNTPLCHDINQATRAENRLDIVMGFVHGNIIWYDPISGKYSRLNKNSGYNPAIICAKWIPNSDSLFMVGTSDGGVMIMDRTKEDFCVPALANSNKRLSAMGAFDVACSQKPKHNPVAYWKVGNKPVTSIAFSPDCQRVAVTSEDGALRIIDYLNEILEDVYLSYFGGLTCCAWSDDGKYVVAGGMDDLITIWSYYDQSIVARCQGHESWVRAVAFDPMGHEDESTYRFMSVGDDAKLLVWDFSLAALHRPRAQLHRAPASASGGKSPNATHGLVASPSDLAVAPLQHLQGRLDTDDSPSDVVHSRMPRGGVAVLQPLMSETIHDTAICSLQFSNDLLVTACRRGIVKVWKRPATFDPSSYI